MDWEKRFREHQAIWQYPGYGSHVEYANYICWISNTYYVPFESTLPARHDERPKHIGLFFFLLIRKSIFF